MAGNFNKVLLMGNLTRDIEIRHTQSNTAIGKFGIAVNRKYSVGDGSNREQREETSFIDCEVWGRTAEIMSQYLRKGRPVFIEGRLRLDQWEDKTSGQRRSKLLVVVENFQFVDSRADGAGGGSGGGGGGESGGRRAPAGARSDGGGGGGGGQRYDEIPPDDDIPF
ncbi:MAG: single-stranded DNA-binding protein [Planctomycetota bacterium]|nr:single-stranded DNA-binding protein [Planctomycetota bacterium]